MDKNMIVKIIVAVALIAGGWWWFTRRNGEEDFQRAMESMKTVTSFRAQMVSSDGQATFVEHECPSSSRTKSPDSEQVQVGTEMYYRYASGGWTRSGEPVEHPDLVCKRLSTGQQTDPFPPLVELTRRGLMKQGSVVRVGGVKCREWEIQIVHPLGTRKETVCLSTDDFRPVQWKVEGATTTYSDYNKPMNIRAPEAAALTEQ